MPPISGTFLVSQICFPWQCVISAKSLQWSQRCLLSRTRRSQLRLLTLLHNFLRSHCVLNEQVTNGCAIIIGELRAAVDLFLMGFPIIQTIAAIRNHPRQPACISYFLCTDPAFSRSRSLLGVRLH